MTTNEVAKVRTIHSLPVLLEEMRSIKQLTRQILLEHQLMRQDIVHLKRGMAQQTKLQRQLGVRVSSLTPTAYRDHHQDQQHYIRLPKHLVSKTLETRLEAIRDMPFLSRYPILDCMLPFVVDDIQKPTAAIVKADKPIYVYVNEAFCSVFKYSHVT